MKKLTIYTFLLWGIISSVIVGFALYAPTWLGVESQESTSTPIEYADRFFMPILCDSLEHFASKATVQVRGPRWYRRVCTTEFSDANEKNSSAAFKELSSLAETYPDYIEGCEAEDNTIVLKTKVVKIDGEWYTHYPVAALSIIFQRREQHE
jgi:hypothetical protein